MNYDLNINDRPFNAIKAGTKKIEGRTRKSDNDIDYDLVASGDILTFANKTTNEKMVCEVLFVTKYGDVRSMLEVEGVENVLSSGLDIEGGIESYNSLEGYEEGIKKYGIWAIGVKCINS